MNQRTLALFDFDGTITSRDTLPEFIIFAKGWIRFALGTALLSPILALFKAGAIPAWRAKEALMTLFFGGMNEHEFQAVCDRFSTDRIPTLVRAAAIKRITDHQRCGHRVVVVSASPENWVGRWAETNGLEWIATRMDCLNGRITGKISGKNCQGMEKVFRIKNYLDLTNYTRIYAYGDSQGDMPLLRLGTCAYYRPFR